MSKLIKCHLCKKVEPVKKDKHLGISIDEYELYNYERKFLWGADICKKCDEKLKKGGCFKNGN